MLSPLSTPVPTVALNQAPAILPLPEVPGVFCDAYLITDGEPRFLSLWGRDTAVHHLLARLNLPDSEDGLLTFTLSDDRDRHEQRITVLDSERLVKLTARKSATLFGELVNLWLYDPIAQTPDRANAQALLLSRKDTLAQNEAPLWALLCQLLWLPVLEAWRPVILARFLAEGWIEPLRGFQINAWRIDLSARERVETAMTTWLQAGELDVA